jgi:hypothetical protein
MTKLKFRRLYFVDMSIPWFEAEASLYTTNNQYSGHSYHMADRYVILPMQYFKVIRSQVKCGPCNCCTCFGVEDYSIGESHWETVCDGPCMDRCGRPSTPKNIVWA